MTPKKKLVISDSPSEDLGYKRTHRQTNGGIQAYIRGEMPMSYWTKDRLMKKVVACFKKLKNDEKYFKKYNNLIKYLNMPEENVIAKIQEHTLKDLKQAFLDYKGTHYTGNYFRYTKFYGLVEPSLFLIRIKNKLVEPIRYEQLKLNIGV